jgi:hypothetical protein
VLRSVRVILAIGIGDQLEQVAGRRVTAALAEVVRDPPHAAAGQAQHGPGVRQQRRAHRPRCGQGRIGGDRALDQGRGSLLPQAGLLRGHLGEGDGLDQAVYQHCSVPGQGDKRVAAQRDDRVPHSQRVTYQRPDRGRDLWGRLIGGLRVGEKHDQRYQLGRQACQQQPQQARRSRCRLH